MTLACSFFLHPDGCGLAERGRRAKVFVLTSHGSAPYVELLEGFEKGCARGGLRAEFTVENVEGKDADRIMENANREGADLLFAIGLHAMEVLAAKSPAIPVLCGLIPGPEEIGAHKNMTGVAMGFAYEAQFQQMRKILPGCRRVGVVYSAANKERIERAARAAVAQGWVFQSRQVASPSEIPEALDYLANRIDVLWTIPDELSCSPQTAQFLLLYSFRNRIPLVGLSAFWTKAGALYSLEWDYRDLGEQCAEMALRVLSGTSPGSCPPARPRKMLYSINMKTAYHMKLVIPDEVVRKAVQVFE